MFFRTLICSLKISIAVSSCFIIALIFWGAIDISFGCIELQTSHPNECVLILIVSLFLYYRIKYDFTLIKQIDAINNFLIKKEKLSLFILLSFSFIYILRIKLFQHFTFNTGAFDLAMYDTAVRNTLDGKFLFADQLGRNFFSEHFSPILLLICPFYLIFDSPVILLVSKALVVAFGVLFVYKIGKHYRLSPVVALLVSLIFLNYKYLARGIWFDFHPEMMEPTFILGAIFFLLKRKMWPYFVFLILALSCKEDIPIYAFGIGIYALFSRKTRLIGWITCVISIAWAIVAWKFVIPAAMPDAAVVSHFVAARWGHLGSNYQEVAVTLLNQPFYVIKCAFSEAPVDMLKTLAFIPFLGIEALMIALPGLILNTTANYEPQAALLLHYSAPIIPFVIWGYIIGLKRLRDFVLLVPWCQKKPQLVLAFGVSVLTVLMALSFGADYKFYSFNAHVMAKYRVMNQIPSGASVSCGTDFVPHLVRKAHPYCFPYDQSRDRRYRHCDFILVDRKGNPWPLQKEKLNSEIDSILNQTSKYCVVKSEDGVYLFDNIYKNRILR